MRIRRIVVFVTLLVSVVSISAQEATSSTSGRRLGVFTSLATPRVVEANGVASSTGPWGQLWLDSGSGYPGPVLFSNGQPLLLANSGNEALRVHPDGHISVGGPYNLARFTVLNYRNGGTGLYSLHQSAVSATADQTEYGTLSVERQDVSSGVTNLGTITGAQLEAWNYGPGTINHVIGGRFLVGIPSNTPSLVINPSTTITKATGLQISVNSAAGTITEARGIFIEDVKGTTAYGIYQAGTNDKNHFAGDTFFAGTVTGTNISATYQDIAEWVPANEDLTPGTVVVLDPAIGNGVMRSARPYDTTVAGVVSAQPGITLGKGGAGQEQIATTGRVKVFVDATAAPIAVGDLLVTSSVSGMAMKSLPVEVGGISMHRPGTIIGKALEPLAGGKGEILVLLSMQ